MRTVPDSVVSNSSAASWRSRAGCRGSASQPLLHPHFQRAERILLEAGVGVNAEDIPEQAALSKALGQLLRRHSTNTVHLADDGVHVVAVMPGEDVDASPAVPRRVVTDLDNAIDEAAYGTLNASSSQGTA